jgi:hypothetical protein
MVKKLPNDLMKHINSFIKIPDSERYHQTSTLINHFINKSNKRLHAFELYMFEKYIPFIVKDIARRYHDDDEFTKHIFIYYIHHLKLIQHAKLSEIIFNNHHL